ncbi:MAG: tRNA (adenosine(37)-N6)-dimethylallyltransferase MiaA [Alphaproteobacteria bacterium]|nr:tRNA (adenosine(37)-N6)-dimethylallyltransferase MiaA [Alphaproteobacteria bacterium]
MHEQPLALIIAGPTASGKSHLALMLAEALDGVIINGDSMQLYDALPILTAHPSPEDQERVPHHLYSVLNVTQTASAAWWKERATLEIHKAHDLNKCPIIVGGTGFYLTALQNGLSLIPEIPQIIRMEVRALSLESLLKALLESDPEALTIIEHNDKNRLARALEVMRATGRTLKSYQEEKARPPSPFRYYRLLLDPPRDQLKERANNRLEKMIEQGALKEVEAFLDHAYARTSPLYKALGVRELEAHLSGQLTSKEALMRAQISTHQYIKRQQTWFRHQFQAHRIIDEFPELFTRHIYKKVLKEIDDHLNIAMSDL